MQSHAKLSRDGRWWTAAFVDAPGCVTQGSTREKAIVAAGEALSGWLEAHLVDGRSPPRARKRGGAVAVNVDPQVDIAVSLRRSAIEAGSTQLYPATPIAV